VELPQHEETTPLNSRLPYAVVKNVGECFCRSYQREFGLNFTIFRFFNTYGPKQSTDFVISRFLKAALNNQPLKINGNGEQTRTFCFIDDNTECTQHILEDDLVMNDVINIGSEQHVTIAHLAALIITLTNSKSEIAFLPPLKEGDMTRRQPDIGKMRQILKRDLVSLADGLQKILSTDMKFLND
jgi:UDP-glucose 4-epimerase